MPCCFSPGVYNPAGCPEQLILIRSASNVFPSRDRNMLLTSGVSSTSGGGDQCFLTIMGKKKPCLLRESVVHWVGIPQKIKVCFSICRAPAAGASWSSPAAAGQSQPAASTAASEREDPEER